MIQLPNLPLPKPAGDQLKAYQAEVNAARSFPARVTAAKTLFEKRNTTKNATFRVVRTTLDLTCSGARRCCYCEDSVADEVEHIKPKDWYPESVFVWENYLYACGPCNGPKKNKFSIFHQQNRNVIHLSRTKDDPIRKPPAGEPLLIDPRAEDPLDFLELDLSGTFYFLPCRGLGDRETQRAEYTIELLKLNSRDVLTRARRNAFGTYFARLEQYTVHKDAGKPQKDLSILIDDLQQVPHRTVWLEMKRQRQNYQKFNKLFNQSVEALLW